MKKIYGKYKNIIENGLFPLLLFVYPLIKLNQGVDVADTTYSLTNFQYFGQMEGTWMVATFLANAAGSLFMRLPFGGTLMGMYFYTSLVQSATALMVYFGLRRKVPALFLFLGEMAALGLCWCPSTILYNYLTYFLMTAAVLLIWRGFLEIKERLLFFEAKSVAKEAVYFAAAGVCLGLNVAVRMPNVVQAAFILAVWYGVLLLSRENGGQEAAGDAARHMAGEKAGLPWGALARVTAWCLSGYILGFGVPFTAVCVRYGFSAYPDMVKTMFAMTEKATDYKPASMLTGMFGDYGKGLYWMVFAAVCMTAAWLAFLARERLYGGGKGRGGEFLRPEALSEIRKTYKITGVIITGVYIALLLVLLRFYWGRGMFTFHYYEHDCRSIYYPAVLFLLVAVYVCVYSLFVRRIGWEQKILAALLLIQIFVTPLGSNNMLYPIINNLFLVVPFTFWTVYRLWTEGEGTHLADPRAVWMVPFTLLTLFLLVQSIGFHVNFVFQDGIWGEPRNRKVDLPEKAAGIYTNPENQALLEELAYFINEEGFGGRELVTYGELPGLSYMLDMPPALSTAWPDLDSYRMSEYERDLAALTEKVTAGEEPPVIILSASVAAYLSDDGEAIVWFGVDMEAMKADEKLQNLAAFMREHGYAECFGNARYVVYQA